MPWIQVYAPIKDSIGLSAAVAAIPLAVVFVCLAILRIKAFKAVLLALAAAVGLSIFAWGMPSKLAGLAMLHGAAFRPFPVYFIVLSTLFLYNVTVKGGQFDVIRASLASVTSDRRLQALLIAFCFGAFIEGAAGFGTPVAIAGATLAGLGFRPFYAAAICLVANTAPVAFGAIGTAVVALGGVMGLNDAGLMKLSTMVGHQLPFVSLIIPSYIVLIMVGFRRYLEVLHDQDDVGRDDQGDERDAADDDGGEDFQVSPEADHDQDDVGRDDQGDERQLVAHHGGELHQARVVQAHDSAQRHDGRADGAKCDGRRVRDQANRGGVEGPETQARQGGAGYRDGGAKSRGSLDERPEAKRDEKRLEPPIRGHAGKRRPDDIELAAFDRDVIEKKGRKDDEVDRKQAEGRAVKHGESGELRGHSPGEDGEADGRGQRKEHRLERLDPENRKAHEDHRERNGGDRGGQPDAVFDGGINLDPGHRGSCGRQRDPSRPCLDD